MSPEVSDIRQSGTVGIVTNNPDDYIVRGRKSTGWSGPQGVQGVDGIMGSQGISGTSTATYTTASSILSNFNT